MFSSCIKRKLTIPIKHELVDNRLSPSSNPTTDRQESAYRDTSSLGIQKTQQTRVQDLFSYSHEGAYSGTSRLGIQSSSYQKTQQTKVQRFVFLQPRKCLQRHFQTGNPKDTIDKQYPSHTNTPNLNKIIIIKGNSLK